MSYQVQVNKETCINCGICMDLCPMRCLDMTRPAGKGEIGPENERQSPIPGESANRPWMMLSPVQVSPCVGCQVCVQECPTHAITIKSHINNVVYAERGLLYSLPSQSQENWQTLDAYTRATPEEPGDAPWGENRAWHVAERRETWQSWRSWLGERKENLRAPCQQACPVGTNAGLYVSLIAAGRYDKALQVAAEPNPFPAICGRVCTAPCEEVCRRGEFDAPIAIRDLKRFASDHGRPLQRKMNPPKRTYAERIAIVGAGPTGLSAAYYLARHGYQNITVFDAMPVAGGMMAIGIPDYRLPRVELNRDIDAIRDLGVEIQLNTAIGRDISLDTLQQQYDAVLLAVGAQQSQRLDIPGEKTLEGVIPATTFLKQFNLETETHLAGDVAVIGGGSTAMDAARSALRAGASKVTILYRRTQNEMPAQQEEIRAALAEGIQLQELTAPLQILGQNNQVQAIRCQRMKLGEPDTRGRKAPVPIPNSTFDLAVSTVLVAIGEAPDPSFLPAGTSINVAAWGGLLINPETLATGAPGVFAAGDVTYGPKTIIHAAAHGRKAAKSIHAYLRKLSPQAIAEMPDNEFETNSPLPAHGQITIDIRPLAREEMPFHAGNPTANRSIEFASGFTEEQARREANRCLRCDLAYRCPTIKTVVPVHSK